MSDWPPVEETRKLAEAGLAIAQYALGFLYAYGEGVPQDYAEAAKWYRKAADQGLAVAQYSLGTMYHHGQGVMVDRTEAANWFRKGAELGHIEAQCDLGMMYSWGQGVPMNQIEAYALFDLAALSNQTARENKEELKKRLSPEQLARAQQRSTELHKEIEARKKAAGK